MSYATNGAITTSDGAQIRYQQAGSGGLGGAPHSPSGFLADGCGIRQTGRRVERTSSRAAPQASFLSPRVTASVAGVDHDDRELACGAGLQFGEKR